MAKMQTSNIVGSASKRLWSQAQVFSINESSRVLVVIQLTIQDDDSLIDLAVVGAEILLELENKATARQSEPLDQIVQSLVEEMANEIKIELVVAKQESDQLTMCGAGGMEAYLVRDGLMAGLYPVAGKAQAVTGKIMASDTIFLGTSKLVKFVGIKKLQAMLIEDEAPEELLATLIHTQADSSGFGAIVAKVEEEEKLESGAGIWEKITNYNIKVSLSKAEPKKSNLLIGGAILLALVMMIGIGVIRRNKQIAEAEYSTLSSSVEQSISEATSLGSLNSERAKVLLTQARAEVDNYLLLEGLREEYVLSARELIKRIEQADEQVFKKNEIQLTTIVELSILAEGLRASQMKSDGREGLVFVDEASDRIVSMSIVDRSRQILETDQGLRDIGVAEGKVYGLDKGGAVEYMWRGGSGKRVIESDEFWVEPMLLEMFAGNIYVLDRSQSEIWRYSTLGGGEFGGRNRWFASTITPDLSNVVDMKISGDIWLLTSSGKLERYSRGAPVSFSMEGFPNKAEPKRFLDPRALWTSETSVYVLESGASRIVVFGDDGKYQAQYLNSEFAKATDLVIVDDKGYVLIDNAVKEFGL